MRKRTQLEESKMSRSLGALAVAALAASVMLAPAATLAFNPQPDPPGKRTLKQSKSLGGPDTKGSKGSWKRIHEVDEKSKKPK
jgi:Spy/CpxP family protein refolding chaperone